jgi:hypothetical protein
MDDTACLSLAEAKGSAGARTDSEAG